MGKEKRIRKTTEGMKACKERAQQSQKEWADEKEIMAQQNSQYRYWRRQMAKDKDSYKAKYRRQREKIKNLTRNIEKVKCMIASMNSGNTEISARHQDCRNATLGVLEDMVKKEQNELEQSKCKAKLGRQYRDECLSQEKEEKTLDRAICRQYRMQKRLNRKLGIANSNYNAFKREQCEEKRRIERLRSDYRRIRKSISCERRTIPKHPDPPVYFSQDCCDGNTADDIINKYQVIPLMMNHFPEGTSEDIKRAANMGMLNAQDAQILGTAHNYTNLLGMPNPIKNPQNADALKQYEAQAAADPTSIGLPNAMNGPNTPYHLNPYVTSPCGPYGMSMLEMAHMQQGPWWRSINHFWKNGLPMHEAGTGCYTGDQDHSDHEDPMNMWDNVANFFENNPRK